MRVAARGDKWCPDGGQHWCASESKPMDIMHLMLFNELGLDSPDLTHFPCSSTTELQGAKLARDHSVEGRKGFCHPHAIFPD